MPRKFILLGGAFICLSLAVAAQQRPRTRQPLIQIAILLDTSNSMDGLIEQAKSQLWKLVNELSLARKDGQPPRLQVSLYEYGKSSLPQDSGYIRMVAPLITDIDQISEKLFELTTNGGDEYCGQAIRQAAGDLAWSPDNGDLKLMFIAGNEEFTQGPVDYRIACTEAAKRGLIVNTIFCGSQPEGARTGWQDGAASGGGSYTNIDQEQRPAAVDAPQDPALDSLNRELNATFLAWGDGGKVGKARQVEQDQNASSYNHQVMSERTMAKTSVHYSVSWDLVDGARAGRVKLDGIVEKDLPFVLRGKTPREQRRYIDRLYADRLAIGNNIRALYLERQRYVDQQLTGKAAQNTLGFAIIKAVRGQASQRGFGFR
jgi:hypothetical protein